MICKGLLVAITAVTFEQTFATALQPRAIRQGAFPTCINLVQYQGGGCCIEGKPCPSPAGTEGTFTGTIALPGQTGNTAAIPTQATVVYTQTSNQDGSIGTIAIIQGGPVTSPITLSAAQTTIDPAGEEAKSSVSAIASSWKGAILPLASSWAQAPDPARAMAAVQAIEGILPQTGGLANSLPNGQIMFNCPGGNAAGALVDQLQAVNCDSLSLLRGLEHGQTITDPSAAAKPIVDEVLANADKIAAGFNGIVGKLDSATGSVTNTGATVVVPPTTGAQTNTEGTVVVPPATGMTEPSITSTMTTLPSGAFIQTLTGGFTAGTVITTTSPGSNDPTIVPVIVPLGGPPQICWGCVPSFPANIQIKIPEFCINIFGFKIGNCPPVEGNGGDGGGGQYDPSKDDPTKDEPTKVDPTDIKPSSTGTSCTTTVTATFESVFCSVTEPADAKRRRQEGTSCSTLAYSTITACSSAVGSTTTTFLPQETDFVLCSPETCGGDSCPSLKRGFEKRAPPPRDSEPAANTWADPSNYGGDQKKFIRGEVSRALADFNTHVPHGWESFSTSNWISFGNTVGNLAVSGLWGCTSVVVVSREGAWASHFWEKPSFQNDFNFQTDVIDRLHTGWGQQNVQEFGLDELRNNDNNPQGHMFDDANNPRIFVMTPRQRVLTASGQATSNSETAGGSTFAYEEYVNRITAELRIIFRSNAVISTVQYSPMTKAPDIVRNPDGTPWINPELNMDEKGPEQDHGDSGFNTHRGKLLVQYQPARGACQANDAPADPPAGQSADQPQGAKWRVWFENNALSDRHAEWVPTQAQLYKRQDSCPIDRQEDNTSTATATGGTSSPTQIPGTCQAVADCTAIICTGHTVQACKAGKCVCDSPTMAEPTCQVDSDCNEPLNCVDGFAKKCYGGQCACLAAVPVETPIDTAAKPTQTQTQQPPASTQVTPPVKIPLTCTLHLHEYALNYNDDTIYFEYSFDNGNGGQPFQGSFTKNWNEVYQVPTSETGLPNPISITLTRDLPPDMEELECPARGGGGGTKINRRCAETQWRSWLLKLNYGNLAWDSRQSQDLSKTPHCQVGDWDDNEWNGISKVDTNRQMDCRFPC